MPAGWLFTGAARYPGTSRCNCYQYALNPS